MNYGKDDDGDNDDDGNGDNDDDNDNDNDGGFLEHKQKGGTLLQQLPHPDNHSVEEVPSIMTMMVMVMMVMVRRWRSFFPN